MTGRFLVPPLAPVPSLIPLAGRDHTAGGRGVGMSRSRRRRHPSPWGNTCTWSTTCSSHTSDEAAYCGSSIRPVRSFARGPELLPCATDQPIQHRSDRLAFVRRLGRGWINGRTEKVDRVAVHQRFPEILQRGMAIEDVHSLEPFALEYGHAHRTLRQRQIPAEVGQFALPHRVGGAEGTGRAAGPRYGRTHGHFVPHRTLIGVMPATLLKRIVYSVQL